MALRPNTNSGQILRVQLDGQTLADLTPTVGWAQQELALGTPAAGTHTIGFFGIAPPSSGDTSVDLDGVGLATVTLPSAVPEPAPFALLAGALGILGATRARRRA